MKRIRCRFLRPRSRSFGTRLSRRSVPAGTYSTGRESIAVINIRADVTRCRKAAQPATDKHLKPEQRADFTVHDLRRTVGTHLQMLGCPLEIIKAILNHKSGNGVTGIYMQAELLPKMLEWLTALDRHYTEVSAPMLMLPPAALALLPPASERPTGELSAPTVAA